MACIHSAKSLFFPKAGQHCPYSPLEQSQAILGLSPSTVWENDPCHGPKLYQVMHRTRERTYALSRSQSKAKPRKGQILENAVCEFKSGGTAHISLLVYTHADLLVSSRCIQLKLKANYVCVYIKVICDIKEIKYS